MENAFSVPSKFSIPYLYRNVPSVHVQDSVMENLLSLGDVVDLVPDGDRHLLLVQGGVEASPEFVDGPPTEAVGLVSHRPLPDLALRVTFLAPDGEIFGVLGDGE